MARTFLDRRFSVALAFVLTFWAASSTTSSAALASETAGEAGTADKITGETAGKTAWVKSWGEKVSRKELSKWSVSLAESGSCLLEPWVNLCKNSAMFQPPTDPQRSMLIHVVDVDGQPIAGAMVIALQYFYDRENVDVTGELNCRPTVTLAEGTARIAKPTSENEGLDVRVIADGYSPLVKGWNLPRKAIEPIPQEFTFKLTPCQPVGGVVRDVSGKPIQGACINFPLFGKADEDNMMEIFDFHQEWTDQYGRWHCHHLPAKLEGRTFTVIHDQYAIMKFSENAVSLEELQAEKAVFVLPPGLVVRGKVVDAQGNPVASAHVGWSLNGVALNESSPQSIFESTDEDGCYRLPRCVAGESTIEVSAKGMVSQRRTIMVQPEMEPVDFHLASGVPTKIRVVDQAGKPLAGAQFVYCNYIPSFPFESEPGISHTSETDNEGRWSFLGSAKEKTTFEVRKSGYLTVRVDVVGRQKEYLITLPPPIRITGRIVDTVTKEPIPNVYVMAKNKPRDHRQLIFGTPAPSINLDPKGNYAVTFEDIKHMDRLIWQLKVQSPGYVTQLSRKFDPKNGSRTFNFELVRGKAISGIVKQPDGSPATGATVFVSTAADLRTVHNGQVDESENAFNTGEHCEHTGPDGRFELAMPLDPYVVGVVYDSGFAQISSQELDAKHEIVLHPWASVEGIVGKTGDPDMDRNSSISIHFLGNRISAKTSGRTQPYIDWDYSADLDASGRFVFDRVVEGPVEMKPWTSSWFVVGGKDIAPWRSQVFNLVGGQTTQVEFAFKGRPVTGHAALPSSDSTHSNVQGLGRLTFQRPLVPSSPNSAELSAAALRQWEKQWLDSDAGKAADRAAQNHMFAISPEGDFHAENVAPGVYQLVTELFDANEKGRLSDKAIAQWTSEVVIPEANASNDAPFELGHFTMELTKPAHKHVARPGIFSKFHRFSKSHRRAARHSKQPIRQPSYDAVRFEFHLVPKIAHVPSCSYSMDAAFM